MSTYYKGPFYNEYVKQNNDLDPRVDDKLASLDDRGVVLQYHYISNNKQPLGSKHLLDKASDGSEYSKLHDKVHPIIRNYLSKFGYYDIFLVDVNSGHIIYSVYKELDYATSLITGSYSQTNFAEVFRSARQASSKNFVKLVDYENYSPSYEAPASFIASPIYDGNRKVAIAVFQMPLDRLNAIMTERSGMGETGETFLVGPDFLMRSDSHLDSEKYSVVSSYRNPVESEIKIDAINQALEGKSGNVITKNYLGEDVVASYGPVDFIGLKWAIFASKNVSEAFGPATTLSYWMAGIALASICFTFIFGTFVGRSIANPILKVANELGENSMVVALPSDELANSSRQLSDLASQQASSIESTAASIEEISAMVNNNVEQSEKSTQLSGQVKATADQGNQSMNKLIGSMEDIIASNEKIQELVKVISEIGEKTGVIDEIVFQTKLLSFNASVEAERAGEHGRGFAVVAQEVGNLAQMSGKAASEIASMVKSSVKSAEAITNENKAKVELGHDLVKDTAKYLAEIAHDAEDLLSQAQQITNASKEQSEGIAQVNRAMGELDKATQLNSQTSRSTAKSSEDMASQAERLKENISLLVTLVEGQKTDRASQRQGIEPRVSAEGGFAERQEPSVVNLSLRRSEKLRSSSPYPSNSVKKVSGSELAGDSSSDEWDRL